MAIAVVTTALREENYDLLDRLLSQHPTILLRTINGHPLYVQAPMTEKMIRYLWSHQIDFADYLSQSDLAEFHRFDTCIPIDWSKINLSLVKTPEQIDFLVQRGVQIDSSHSGLTPLQIACVYGRIDLIEKFLHLGADPQKTNMYGLSAINYARDRQTVNLLTDYGAQYCYHPADCFSRPNLRWYIKHGVKLQRLLLNLLRCSPLIDPRIIRTIAQYANIPI